MKSYNIAVLAGDGIGPGVKGKDPCSYNNLTPAEEMKGGDSRGWR